MAESLLYKLVKNGLEEGVSVDTNRFKEVYRSKYGKVRIYRVLSVSKESKEWVADPANRICDSPGSWFCRGQYPPVLEKILKEKKNFRQLEDFNAKSDVDSEYQKDYFENLVGGKDRPRPPVEAKKKIAKPLTKEDIEEMNKDWKNDYQTTVIWKLISGGHLDKLKELLGKIPSAAHVRSEDGRGPMWWAYEYGRDDIIDVLKSRGVSDMRKDSDGKTPIDLYAKSEQDDAKAEETSDESEHAEESSEESEQAEESSEQAEGSSEQAEESSEQAEESSEQAEESSEQAEESSERAEESSEQAEETSEENSEQVEEETSEQAEETEQESE
jgi:hypothetical protein